MKKTLYTSILILFFCSFSFSNKISAYTPIYQSALKEQPTGFQLLKEVQEFLNQPERNQNLLQKILQSGNIDGFFDHVQVFGVFEYLLEHYTHIVKGFESIGQTFEQNETMALRIGFRNKHEMRSPANSIYTNPVYERELLRNSEADPDHVLNNREFEHVTRKSLLLFTGAHHSRELLTQNMIVKIALEMTHLLQYSKLENLPFWKFSDVLLVPFVNLDGHKFISDAFHNISTYYTDNFKQGFYGDMNARFMFDKMKYKRKNMNSSYCKSDKIGTDLGVDLNRNYGYHWNHSEFEDEKECTEVFKGPHPFSEPETQNMKRLIDREKNHLTLVLNFHTYGNLWVRPFNFSKHESLNFFQMDSHLLRFYEQMETKITSVCPHAIVGNAIKTVDYQAMGEASDWILGEHKIISYSPELGYSDPTFDDFFIQKGLINKALDENYRVIQMMMESSRFRIREFDFFLTNSNAFTFEFENFTLGKLFNGVIRLKANDPNFYKLIKSVHLTQESNPSENLQFEILSDDGDLFGEQFEEVGSSGESRDLQFYVEISVPELDNLSKARIELYMNEGVKHLSTVEFEMNFVFENIFSLELVAFSYTFGSHDNWRFWFIVVVICNVVVLFFYLIAKLFCKKKKKVEKLSKQEGEAQPSEKESKNANLKKPLTCPFADIK